MLRSLEIQWRKSSPRLDAKTLKETFPDIFEQELRRTLTEEKKKYETRLQKYKEMSTRYANSTPEVKNLLKGVMEDVGIPLLLQGKDLIARKLILLGYEVPGRKLKISQQELDRARSTSIVRLAEFNGLYPRKTGGRFYILCPFHEERHASCVLYPLTNTFHCFGCAGHGDVVKLAMHLRGEDFKQSITYLNTL